MHWRYHSLTLTHWGRVTHICVGICVGKLTILGSDNGLSPGRRQAIIWTNAGILLIGPLGTNFTEILIEIKTFSFKKMRLKVSSAKWRPLCLGLNELSHQNDIMELIITDSSNNFILIYKDHSVNAPSQWEMMLHCNVVSHWLATYTVPSPEPMLTYFQLNT